MPNLTQISAQQERALLRAFRDAIQSVKDQAVISEIAALLDANDVEGVVTLLQLDLGTFRPIENATRAAYEKGGDIGAEQIGRFPAKGGAGTLVLRFNVRSPRAESWASQLSSKRIVEMAEETKAVVRNVLTDALAQGQGVRTTALDLVGRIDPMTRKRTGGYIGLTENQAQWAKNARRELNELNPNYLTRELRDRRLDGAFKRAVKDGKPLTSKQIDTAVSRLQARALRFRGEAIAQTESLQALSEGQNEAIQQALEAGEVEDEFTRKFWRSTGAGKEPRVDHLAVESDYPEGLPMNEPFIVGGEAMQRPREPGASAENVIRCKCYLSTRINFAGQAAKEIRGFGQ